MFNVSLYTGDEDLPQGYLIAENGVYRKVDTGFYTAIVPSSLEAIKKIADPIVPKVELNLPKIPQKLTWQTKKFFAEVVEKFRAESIVTLCYSREKREYKLRCPPQNVSYGGINYDRNIRNDPSFLGYDQIGTIHSHCDFAAFHSGTDDSDEITFDGIHLTFGHNDQDDFTISSSLMVSKERLNIPTSSILEGVEQDLENGLFRLIDVNEQEAEQWSQESAHWIENVTGRC